MTGAPDDRLARYVCSFQTELEAEAGRMGSGSTMGTAIGLDQQAGLRDSVRLALPV